MNACDICPNGCDGRFHDSTDEQGRRLHSRVWKVLGGQGEIAALLRHGAPAYVNISLEGDGDYPADEVRGFADVEPAEYERALREAADMVDEINRDRAID